MTEPTKTLYERIATALLADNDYLVRTNVMGIESEMLSMWDIVLIIESVMSAKQEGDAND